MEVPEGRRMSKLRQVLETALEMSLKELGTAKTQRQVKRVFSSGSGRHKAAIVDTRVALAHTRVAATEVCDHVRVRTRLWWGVGCRPRDGWCSRQPSHPPSCVVVGRTRFRRAAGGV